MSKPDYTADIVAFLRDMVPVEGAYGPKMLVPPHMDGFLRRAFPGPAGDPAERNAIDSRVKKQGKSALAAGVALYQATRRPYSECVIAAADKDQAKDRVLRAVKYAIDNGPLRKHAKVYTDVIEFSNKSTITALPQDWRGAAGGNYAAVVFDELWTYTLENQRRMFDELIIPPTAVAGVRWISTYAGFLGESLLLWEIWQRALAGELVQEDPPIYHNRDAGLLALIDQGERAWRMPWSTGEAGRRFMEQTRAAERPTTWQRIWLNEWVSAQSQFVPMDEWDALVDLDLHPAAPGVPIVFGADASVKHDCTALLGCTYNKERERVELAYCKVWTPRILGKLDPDKTIGDELRRLKETGHNIKAVLCDPWQMVSVAEKLKEAGIRVEEFPQGPRRVESDQALFSAITTGALATYAEQTLRQHVQNAVAVESVRGMRLDKSKTSAKIDAVVALSMAHWGALEQLAVKPATIENLPFGLYDDRFWTPSRSPAPGQIWDDNGVFIGQHRRTDLTWQTCAHMRHNGGFGCLQHEAELQEERERSRREEEPILPSAYIDIFGESK